VSCEKHDWDWDISDPTGCPICYGESLERERIIKLLEDRLQETVLPDGTLFIESTVIKQLCKLIKEENNG
jgi:hypothetical protein